MNENDQQNASQNAEPDVNEAPPQREGYTQDVEGDVMAAPDRDVVENDTDDDDDENNDSGTKEGN